MIQADIPTPLELAETSLLHEFKTHPVMARVLLPLCLRKLILFLKLYTFIQRSQRLA